jgi:hypothetical protein
LRDFLWEVSRARRRVFLDPVPTSKTALTGNPAAPAIDNRSIIDYNLQCRCVASRAIHIGSENNDNRREKKRRGTVAMTIADLQSQDNTVLASGSVKVTKAFMFPAGRWFYIVEDSHSRTRCWTFARAYVLYLVKIKERITGREICDEMDKVYNIK